jgi:eukaryotic-like serine/threonine-protein kinase
MQLGTQLGPYQIVSAIGKGGMGEVYRAIDSRLDREVAIKVSDERFSERLEREVRAVAALNHPNICTLYDVGPNFLVMEYVEGENLKGPLPLDETLRIARQIADALDEAHSKGIVHRDLKPGNIKIKPDGTVKVLDFGLAKLGGTPAAPSEDSPTISIPATQAGVILGTAAYMSPEQARGKQVDKRTDIWAFGVVLYEILTGERLFEGEDVTDTLAAVIRKEPVWERVPVEVRRLLKACLEKDPKRRLRDLADAWRLLDEAPRPLHLRRPFTERHTFSRTGDTSSTPLVSPFISGLSMDAVNGLSMQGCGRSMLRRPNLGTWVTCFMSVKRPCCLNR